MTRHSGDSMYAVSWKHYTRSSRTMTAMRKGEKVVSVPKTQKQIDDEIKKVRQEIARLDQYNFTSDGQHI